MGLRQWVVIVEMDPEFCTDETGIASFYWIAETITKPQYEHATLHFFGPACEKIADDELEETVIHELMHVLLAEAKIKDLDREEHIATLLSRAFMRCLPN